MPLKLVLERIASVGVRQNYQPWEIYLTRKQNLVSLLGTFNLIIATIILLVIGYPELAWQVAGCLILPPFVYLLNKRSGYVAASYVFVAVGYVVFFLLSVRLGDESWSFLYYFPLIIGITQMLGRKEMLKHLIVQLVICFSAIFLATYCNQKDFFQSINLGENLSTIRTINIVFAFFTTMFFVVIITIESIKQEYQIKTAVKQKEVLLAELFHRVKNNLNIVTSILNLKKGTVESEEGRQALEDCRNMVFSMALVHTKVYNSARIDTLNFREYLKDLIKDLQASIGGKCQIDFIGDQMDVFLSVSKAIPCGLIVNELVTNAFKHAKVEGQELLIQVSLMQNIGDVKLVVQDNGPGMENNLHNHNSMGVELIKSLSEQIDGICKFENSKGLKFELTFKI
ncbi:MAG: sensor histidine kinase [Sphingobacteriaceae bacterium]|nr:sensor histidine kinase [Sphingobacteriaceae bacterium]